MQWHDLATTSHVQTAIAVKQVLVDGHIDEAMVGLEELIDALSRSDKRALRSQLIRLMAHVIKWHTRPDQRSRSWAATIENARIDIEELLELEPSLRPSVPGLLKELFEKAKRSAEKEMSAKTARTEISWHEVFEDDYTLQ
jgi:hypothetical protein